MVCLQAAQTVLPAAADSFPAVAAAVAAAVAVGTLVANGNQAGALQEAGTASPPGDWAGCQRWEGKAGRAVWAYPGLGVLSGWGEKN